MTVENLNALWMVYKAVDSFRLELGLGNSFAFWSSESQQILGAGGFPDIVNFGNRKVLVQSRRRPNKQDGSPS